LSSDIVDIIVEMLAVIPTVDFLRNRRLEHWQERLQKFYGQFPIEHRKGGDNENDEQV